MVDDSVKIRDFALEKAGDAKVKYKKGLNFKDMAATLNIKDQMGEGNVEGKMGSVGIEVKLPAMDKAGDYKLENKMYNANDKNTTDTMEMPSATKVKPASVGKLGNKTYDPNHKDTAEAMGKVDTKTKDKKIAVADMDDSDDYLKDGWLFDMEDIVCKYT
jgi:hypothetical protein